MLAGVVPVALAPGAATTAALAALVAVSLALSVVGGPFYGYTDRAATDLADRRPYVSAVLGEEAR